MLIMVGVEVKLAYWYGGLMRMGVIKSGLLSQVGRWIFMMFVYILTVLLIGLILEIVTILILLMVL